MCVFLWLCMCTRARILTMCLLCVCVCIGACVRLYVCVHVRMCICVCVFFPKLNFCTFINCVTLICSVQQTRLGGVYKTNAWKENSAAPRSLSTRQHYLKHVYVYSESVCLYIINTLSVNGMRTYIHCLYINCSH